MKWSRVEHSFIKWPRENFFMEFWPPSTFTFMFWPGLEVSCLQNGHSILGKLENGHCAEPSPRSGALIGCLWVFPGLKLLAEIRRPIFSHFELGIHAQVCSHTTLLLQEGGTAVGVCLQRQRQEAFPRHEEQQRTVCCSLPRWHLHLQGKYQTPQRWAVHIVKFIPHSCKSNFPTIKTAWMHERSKQVLMKTQKMDTKNLTTTLKDEDGVVVAKSTAYVGFCSARKSIAKEGDVRSIDQSFGNARV